MLHSIEIKIIISMRLNHSSIRTTIDNSSITKGAITTSTTIEAEAEVMVIISQHVSYVAKLGTLLLFVIRFNKKYAPAPNHSKEVVTPQLGSNPWAFVATQSNNLFLATPEIVSDPNWNADNERTNHVIADYNNKENPTKYGGNEFVTIGNGDKLRISCVGNSCLTKGKSLLSLENILCVPEIAKSLVNVSKLV